MWTTLENCCEGDYIRAYFLGDSDVDSSSNHSWHKIYTLEQKSNGDFYAAIEGYGGRILSKYTDVYKKV